MKTGMMWLDADAKRPLEEKVRQAADYYREKYGQIPNLCLVNKAALKSEQLIDKILVQPAKTVLPNHFWLGVESP